MWEDYRDCIIKNKKIENDWYIIGIDLGTTHSVISYITSDMTKPEVVDTSNGFGKIPMPSVVQYRKYHNDEEWVIGDEAYQSFKIYPESTIMSVKKLMGTTEKITIRDKEKLPEEISAMILKELINHLENVNPKITLIGAVVSVPYDFDDSAKKATIKACRLAGLSDNLICLIEEPKAALLSYNYYHELNNDEKVMVFDFGGGTLDITIFEMMKEGNNLSLKVLSEGGEATHGGDCIDGALFDILADIYEKKTGVSKDKLSKEQYADLFVKGKEVKERLSGVKKYRIPFTFCVPPFIHELTRECFELTIESFIKKTRLLIMQALKESYNGALKPYDISKVILEGGSSMMPWVKELMLTIFNDEEKIYISEKPALDISLGATYYAAMKMGVLDHTDMIFAKEKIDFVVSLPHDIGFEIVLNDKTVFHRMISRGTPYALAKKSQVFTLTGETLEDMTSFKLKILERINKNDDLNTCHLIGEIEVVGLPARPSGKTKLKITLIVEEEDGIIKGLIEDVGFDSEYPSSGFKQYFEPNSYCKTVIDLMDY